MNLVSGAASDSLDDGEAATIAFALEQSAIALIDERKANRICRERFAGLAVAKTIDVLAHKNVQAAMGRDRLAEAVFNALNDSRMRVPIDQIEWVIQLLGAERAAKCVSLPRSAFRQA
jgi:predicted nucleic acid-binding protein